MFRIRFVTPSVVNGEGHPMAGGELQLGTERLGFLIDLRYWSQADYEQQWRKGVARLAHGAPSTALMTAYRGPDGDAHHLMFALWRDDDHVYAQELSVLSAELDAPLDPAQPWDHVGQRVPAAEQGLPLVELRCDLVALLGSYFLPSFPWYLRGGESAA